MLEDLSRHKRNMGLLAVALVVGFFAWKIRAVINPLILGYLLAFILQPAVERLQARGLKRSGAVLSVFGLAFGGTLLLGLGVVYQGRVLIERFSPDETTAEIELIESAEEVPPAEEVDEGGSEHQTGSERLEAFRVWLEERLGPEWVPPAPSLEAFEALFEENEDARAFAGKAGVAVASTLGGALRSFFGGVVGIRDHIPVRQRDRFVSLFERLGEVLSVFFRGRLLVCLIKGGFLTVALIVAGIPFALLLGLGGGFLSIVPFLGGIAAFGAALVVALTTHSLVHALVATALIFALAELFEGYVLMPRILGDSLGLTDVTVLFAITAGGAALGLLGVLIALPLAAAVKILYQEFVEPALEQFVEEDPEPAEA
ncbi:MAG: AI-2E family transporter [Planctomycetota bacterium]|jgi:predicted PurR-regulated permease PerM